MLVSRLVAEGLARRGLTRRVTALLRGGRQTARDFLYGARRHVDWRTPVLHSPRPDAGSSGFGGFLRVMREPTVLKKARPNHIWLQHIDGCSGLQADSGDRPAISTE